MSRFSKHWSSLEPSSWSKEPLAGSTEGWGFLPEDLSESPCIFPALWCPFALGARCQQPVSWMAVMWGAGSELSLHWCSPTAWSQLTCSQSALGSCANFLCSVSFLPPSIFFSFLLSLWFSLVKTLEKHANANVRCLQVWHACDSEPCVMSLLVLRLGL